MPLTQPEVLGKLREYIVRELLRRPVELEDDTPLIESGYLTSLQTVELVAHIAESFHVEIEPEEIDEERFRSLATIAALILGKTS